MIIVFDIGQPHVKYTVGMCAFCEIVKKSIIKKAR